MGFLAFALNLGIPSCLPHSGALPPPTAAPTPDTPHLGWSSSLLEPAAFLSCSGPHFTTR